MIELSDQTVRIMEPDGSCEVFDARAFRESLAELAGISEPEVVNDISLAVEYAVMRMVFPGNKIISRADLNEMVIEILRNINRFTEAEHFRVMTQNVFPGSMVTADSLKVLLTDKLNINGDLLNRIVGKVQNTMTSIGANTASQELAVELGKHFLRLYGKNHVFPVKHPDFRSEPSAGLISANDVLKKLTVGIRMWCDQRILKLHPLDLRIFPSVRIDIRLSGIAAYAKLEAPILELSLAPYFIQVADAVDSLCTTADRICEQYGYETFTPLKLILTFSDASLFTKNKMDCSPVEAGETQSVELAKLFCSMLTRQPVKFTCL